MSGVGGSVSRMPGASIGAQFYGSNHPFIIPGPYSHDSRVPMLGEPEN
jgi:hypothetical protein